jgi:hypothetical protein
VSQQLGLQCGSTFDDYQTGKTDAKAAAKHRTEQARRDAEIAARAHEAATERADERLDRARQRLEIAKHRLEPLAKDRADAPADYSLPRGLLFLAIAILLLAGDLTILAGVLARILDLTSRVVLSDGTAFSVTQILSHPAQGWEQFANILILTASVLLLGFFPKLMLELRRERTSNGFFYGSFVIFVLSVAAVALTAAARFGLDDTAAQTSTAIQAGTAIQASTAAPKSLVFALASVLLGLSMPYASCLFFVRGTEKLGRRVDLWRAASARFMAARDVKARESAAGDATATALTHSLAFQQFSSPGYVELQSQLAAGEFHRAYSDGVVKSVRNAPPGEVFSIMRAAAIRRKLQ